MNDFYSIAALLGWVALGLLGLLLVVTLLRAALFRPKATAANPLPDETADAERAATHLSQAIQIPTVSYPEQERVDWHQFERFHAFLEESFPLLHKTLTREVHQQANLMYRWQGTDPGLKPIALLSHQDVVPVSPGTESDWTHPAFSGHNDGEYIWGRGAMDMKNHLICAMEAVETLLEEGYQPARDVYLLFGQDEEVVGAEYSGAKSMCQILRERGVLLESTLDEGGAMLPINVKGVLKNAVLAGIGVSEKGYADFEISVSAKGGHSSQPPAHTALGDLAAIIRRLEKRQFKAKLLPYLQKLIENAGRRMPYPLRLFVVNQRLLRPVILAAMKKIPFAACMVRTTTAVTQAQGSPACNVLPQKAVAVANFRMMPGTTAADVQTHIERCCKGFNATVKLLKCNEASPFSPTDSNSYRVLASLVQNSHPEAIITPYLVMGGTDSHYYNPICDCTYRFSPFLTDLKLLLCTHATNERIPVETLGEGVKFFKRYIKGAGQ
ncbi:MAG: M20/M25/M40 family metallo-hydrolase [Oscillospiraceae bacterium]|jgi:carboxypeptidase PM20D1|nr:M20/M25/M40 family metallo-hydrolase [Oscillospiraceae bacterium]